MSLLKNLATDNSIEDEKDSLGGGFVVDSGLYDLTIKLAFLTKSKGGALAFNVHFDNDGKELRQQFWITSGDDKGNKTYYEKDGKKFYLPGFNMANGLCLLTLGKEVSDLDTEPKVIKLYDSEAKEERNTEVPMLIELLGQKITAGVLRQIVDKKVKDESTGKYVPNGETREENEADKFFRHEDGLTIAEIKAQKTEAQFKIDWDNKWTGKTVNKAKGVAGNAPKAGAPAGKPRSSLFNKP